MDDTIDYLASHAQYVKGTKEHQEALTASNGTLTATVGMLWLDIEGTQVCMVEENAHCPSLLLHFITTTRFKVGTCCLPSVSPRVVLVQLLLQQHQLSPRHGR